MNIKILDSWLREYLKTKATHEEIADKLSLTSVSIEKIEPFGKGDYVYDIEVTTNRPDLMSVIGIAREAAAVLPQFGIKAEFVPPVLKGPKNKYSSNASEKLPTEKNKVSSLQDRTRNVYQDAYITLKNEPKLVNRICTVVMEVDQHDSPQIIKDRLESSNIRSLNNVIDVTNYVMREIGHPTHVFDYDRLKTKTIEIREARRNEKIVTLDGKEYKLPGGDVVADDGLGHIIDLLGVMGLENSMVTDDTKRILFFIDNLEPTHVRRTSMNTGIRTEAAVLNEKGIDPEVAYEALLRGIELYQELANGKLLSEIIDIYPNKPSEKVVTIDEKKINDVIGLDIETSESIKILTSLGFDVIRHSGKSPKAAHSESKKDPGQATFMQTERSQARMTTNEQAEFLEVIVPSWRKNDVEIPQDLIEEIARIYGYHKLPSILPAVQTAQPFSLTQSEFFWEARVKDALKYWGFTEVYTYSMVSEDLLEGPPEEAVKLKNPLTDEWVYMRKTLVPSLLQAVHENHNREEVKIFELANVYHKRKKDLPEEILTLAGVVKREDVSFYEVKGIIETLFTDLGIEGVQFKPTKRGGEGADIYIIASEPKQSKNNGVMKQSNNQRNAFIGTIEVLEKNLIDFEFNFEEILKHVSLAKVYKPLSKFPPVIEDIRVIIDPEITFEHIVNTIEKQSDLISEVSLLDVYEDKKTFRIKYQDPGKNLTNEDVTPIREKILAALKQTLKAKIA